MAARQDSVCVSECEQTQKRGGRGHTRRLVINVPPRYMKSLLVSVLWPRWDHGKPVPPGRVVPDDQDLP